MSASGAERTRARWLRSDSETAGVYAVSFPYGRGVQDRLAYAGEVYAERYGRAQASNAPPLRRILAAGVPMGAGTDGTRVSGYNPWVALRWMSAGLSAGGQVVRSPADRLSRAQSLHAFTIASAWFSGDERLKGRLAPGQFADLAVLSDDYFAVSDRDIAAITSTLTVTGGRIVHGAGDHADLGPPLPPVSPSWSPVNIMGERS